MEWSMYSCFLYMIVSSCILWYYTTPLETPSSPKPHRRKKPIAYYEKADCIEYCADVTSHHSKTIVYYKEWIRIASTLPSIQVEFHLEQKDESSLYQLKCSGEWTDEIKQMTIHFPNESMDIPIHASETDVILDIIHVHGTTFSMSLSFQATTPTYSNNFKVYVYKVLNPNHYNSILLVRKKNTYVPSFYNRIVSIVSLS